MAVLILKWNDNEIQKKRLPSEAENVEGWMRVVEMNVNSWKVLQPSGFL